MEIMQQEFIHETPAPIDQSVLDAKWLKQRCLDLGADDAGFISVDRPELDNQRDDILKIFPRTKTIISFVCRMNREPVRSSVRSIANHEFHTTGDHTNEVGRAIVTELDKRGICAVNPSIAFPMEVKGFPDEKNWMVEYKPIAVAAGLGKMGIHRNVIHPKYGNFILLGCVLVDAYVTEENKSLDFNPCFECKLCVAACPVGAIEPDGHFNFTSCLTHNYREFLGGFNDWVETVVESKSPKAYYQKVTPGESVSMWQSLSFGANYNAAYCMAVCPAGEDVIGPFTANQKQYLQDIVKPLQQKEETLYVTKNSDARAYATKRYPHKKLKVVSNGLRLQTIKGFISSAHHVFQRHQAKDLQATYHFIFRGEENRKASFIIRDNTLEIQEGLVGEADVTINADSETWIKFLNKETNIVLALMTGKLRIKGSPKLLTAFGKCFG